MSVLGFGTLGFLWHLAFGIWILSRPPDTRARMKTQPAVVTFDRKPYSVELREVPVPDIGDEDVLLEVAAVGVCGSDLHMWTGDHGWRVNYPCILGHEFAGQ